MFDKVIYIIICTCFICFRQRPTWMSWQTPFLGGLEVASVSVSPTFKYYIYYYIILYGHSTICTFLYYTILYCITYLLLYLLLLPTIRLRLLKMPPSLLWRPITTFVAIHSHTIRRSDIKHLKLNSDLLKYTRV